MGEQCRYRSASTSVPSDQDIHCSCFLFIRLFLTNMQSVQIQIRPYSDRMYLPACLDLHWLHTGQNANILRKGLITTQQSICAV